MQQDAHEFLNYLLNTINETLLEEKKAEREKAATKVTTFKCHFSCVCIDHL